MTSNRWFRRTVAAAAIVSAGAMAGCGFNGPYPGTVLHTSASPTHPGGTETVEVGTSAFNRSAGDVVVGFGWQPVSQTGCDTKGGCQPVYPGTAPRVTVLHSNVPCKVNAEPANGYLTVNGTAVDCGRIPAGRPLDLTVQYPVDHSDPRYGVVSVWDAGHCDSWNGCDGWSGSNGSNAEATVNTLPGSVLTWHEEMH